jgi:NAD-reducing hydrogenase large subunit
VNATRTLRLDQVVDGAGTRVVVKLGHDARVEEAWLALDGLPRVEDLLRGRPIHAVPTLVEHLCGICPVAHHLVGARALDRLTGLGVLTPTAQAVRRLLHHGDVLRTHARHLATVDPDRAPVLGAFARQAVTAAAGPGHFPHCAVPGGVVRAVSVPERDALRENLDRAMEHALALVDEFEGGYVRSRLLAFTGYDVALVDADGTLDLYGDHLRAVATDGSVLIPAAEPDRWRDIVAESWPGATASRPYLRVAGAERGGYRVGPVAQLRIGTHLSTACAEEARQRWAAKGAGAMWARAVVALHAVEVIRALTVLPELVAGPLLASATPAHGPSGSRVSRSRATGWVDGARGLLVHTYDVGEGDELIDARITTPTAQNERWLAVMLTTMTAQHALSRARGAIDVPHGLRAEMEAAVREADPCLPCTSLPLNRMDLALAVLDAQGHLVASWEPEHCGPGLAGGGAQPCA